MRLVEQYVDGGTIKTGKKFEGDLDACAEWLVELDTELDVDEDDPDYGRSLNGWTKAQALKALNKAHNRNVLVVDRHGDHQCWLTVSS